MDTFEKFACILRSYYLTLPTFLSFLFLLPSLMSSFGPCDPAQREPCSSALSLLKLRGHAHAAYIDRVRWLE